MVPVFPSLEARFVEKVMKRLPVVEDLVTVMNDVWGGTHVPQHPQSKQRQEPTQPFIELLFIHRFPWFIDLRVRQRRRRCWRIGRCRASLPCGESHDAKLQLQLCKSELGDDCWFDGIVEDECRSGYGIPWFFPSFQRKRKT